MITREPDFMHKPERRLAKLGRRALLNFQSIGQGVIMSVQAIGNFTYMFSRRNRDEVFFQLYLTAIKSIPVLTVVGLFTGMIFALQVGLELQRFGQENQVGSGVTIVMLREMGPFMTALIIAASVGSSIAAQMGTMTVSEEVAALEIMSINPIRFLMMPRMVALVFCMPLLTFYVDIMAFLGGMIVANTQLNVSMHEFWDNSVFIAKNRDLFCGLFKSVIFGIIICGVACYQGFRTTGGAVGVGQATRRTVVFSFLTVLVVGYVITKIFYS